MSDDITDTDRIVAAKVQRFAEVLAEVSKGRLARLQSFEASVRARLAAQTAPDHVHEWIGLWECDPDQLARGVHLPRCVGHCECGAAQEWPA